MGEGPRWLSERGEGEAAVIGPDFSLLSVASDGSQAAFGNSCRSSVICAMGKAGSSVNLRECAVVWRSTKGDLEAFGRMEGRGLARAWPSSLCHPGLVFRRSQESPRSIAGHEVCAYPT